MPIWYYFPIHIIIKKVEWDGAHTLGVRLEDIYLK